MKYVYIIIVVLLLPLLSAAQQNEQADQSAVDKEQRMTILKSGSLSQNVPNPYISRTVINYEMKSEIGRLRIHDLTGNLVLEYILSAKSGQITISDHLDAGLYFYSLWDDREMIDSKRMQVID